MSERPFAEHAATVREARDLAEELTKCWALLPTDEYQYPWRDMDEADKDARLLVAAIVALAERAAELERERNEFCESEKAHYDLAKEATDAYERERERVERAERDYREYLHAYTDANERAERAEEALREIAKVSTDDVIRDAAEHRYIARSALRPPGGPR